MRRTIGLFLLAWMAPGHAYGQTQKPESKAPETRTPETRTPETRTPETRTPETRTMVLKAARLFDGKSNSLVTPGLVIVTGGKISAAGATATVPAGAEGIDLGDAAL